MKVSELIHSNEFLKDRTIYHADIEEAIIQYLDKMGFSEIAEDGRQFGMTFDGYKDKDEPTRMLSITIKKE